MRGLPYNNSCVAGKTTAMRQKNTGCGSAWLERLVWDQEVAGSNPVTPIVENRVHFMLNNTNISEKSIDNKFEMR